jgi:enoyl-CoA hydratase
MSYVNLLYETKDQVALITINNPAKLNALSAAVISELHQALDQVEADANIRAAIITGSGKAFVAGADISEMQGLTPELAMAMASRGLAFGERIDASAKIYIAAVNGYALGGGCELAMACDLRLAAEQAKFGQPEVGLGIIPGFAGTQRLTRLVGVGRAKELILSGDIISASRAYEIGLVNKVCSAEELLPQAWEMAAKILRQAPLAVAYAKHAIDQGLGSDLTTGCELEKRLFGLCFATADQSEGASAFIEKRPAKFQGK